MSAEQIDPLAAALMAAGIGAAVLQQELNEAKAEITRRDSVKDHRTLDRLDRMTLALYYLAEELNERGGKVNGPKVAAKIHAIRSGASYGGAA